MRLYDDSDSSEEGIKKYTMDKHKDSVNHLDFRLTDDLCASCGDDGYIYVFNFQSFFRLKYYIQVGVANKNTSPF